MIEHLRTFDREVPAQVVSVLLYVSIHDPCHKQALEEDLGFREGSLTKDQIQMLRDVGANIKDSGMITCTKGMRTDLASTPRICWALISPWDVARAAIIHDHLYAKLRLYYH